MKNVQHLLIVGGGLAGITLARHLIQHNQRVTIIDSGNNRSSKIAAGMINPMVFRRMTKTWRLDEFLPYAEGFYHSFSEECGLTFYHPITIRRIIASDQEKRYWYERLEDPTYTPYLYPFKEEDSIYDPVLYPFGTGRIKRSAYVDTAAFLTATKDWLREHANYLTTTFEYSHFDPSARSYDGITYDAVVFCEGFEAMHNPWFGHLPVNHTKGETLTVRSTTLPADTSMNRKCFTLPLGDGLFRIGATYSWNTTDTTVTSEARAELLDHLRSVTSEEVEVTEQRAGIRPTTPDRRPIMGEHPDYKNVYIMNGLGSKGYLNAPLLAHEMALHVLEGSALHPECVLTRFNK